MNMKKTTDLYLSAYLMAKGYKLIEVDSKKKCSFSFEISNQIEKDIQDYFNELGSVEPLRFVNAIRNIKTLIFTK